MHGVHVAPVRFRAARLNNGLVAQLVERRLRMAEVRGSSPLKSTKPKKLKLVNIL
jgi:hypothetical protein